VADPPKPSVEVAGLGNLASSSSPGEGAPEGKGVETKLHDASGGSFGAAVEVAAIYDRLRRLESGVNTSRGHWYDSQLFSSVLSGIILAVFGLFLTGRIEQAAKERELNIQSAKEMQELLVKISNGNADEAEAAALSLTTYGRYSIPPLIENLQYAQRAIAAERGLQALALTNGEELCVNLTAVLDNRTQRYTAGGHSAVIRILGAADCKRALPALRRYADMIKRVDTDPGGLAEYQRAVRDATPSNATQARKDLKDTFGLLHVDYAF
jgi:hypothetical protein